MSDTATPSITKGVATTLKFLQQLESAGLTDDDIRRVAGNSELAELWVEAFREMPDLQIREVSPPLIELEIPQYPSTVGARKLLDDLDLRLNPEELALMAVVVAQQGALCELFSRIDAPTNTRGCINAQVRTMIILRYGLIDGETLSYSEVARRIGRSSGMVRERLRKSQWTLRRAILPFVEAERAGLS